MGGFPRFRAAFWSVYPFIPAYVRRYGATVNVAELALAIASTATLWGMASKTCGETAETPPGGSFSLIRPPEVSAQLGRAETARLRGNPPGLPRATFANMSTYSVIEWRPRLISPTEGAPVLR